MFHIHHQINKDWPSIWHALSFFKDSFISTSLPWTMFNRSSKEYCKKKKKINAGMHVLLRKSHSIHQNFSWFNCLSMGKNIRKSNLTLWPLPCDLDVAHLPHTLYHYTYSPPKVFSVLQLLVCKVAVRSSYSSQK